MKASLSGLQSPSIRYITIEQRRAENEGHAQNWNPAPVCRRDVGMTQFMDQFDQQQRQPQKCGTFQRRDASKRGPKRIPFARNKIEPGKARLSYLYKYGPDLLGPNAGAVPRKDNGGEFDLECDAVVLITSRYSDDGLRRELKARKAEWAANEIQDIFRTGDCKAPAQLNQALWDAHRLAREFDSPHPAYPLPWIRERQLWGNPTVPKLGDPRVDVEAGSMQLPSSRDT